MLLTINIERMTRPRNASRERRRPEHCVSMSEPRVVLPRPGEWDAVVREVLLKFANVSQVFVNRVRRALRRDAELRQRAGGFTDVPLDRMQTKTTVRHVCD